MAVRVCTRTATDTVYCVLHGYSDRGGVEERVAVRVQYTTVTVSYMDTVIEGGRGESGSTCTVHVLPQLLCLTRIL